MKLEDNITALVYRQDDGTDVFQLTIPVDPDNPAPIGARTAVRLPNGNIFIGAEMFFDFEDMIETAGNEGADFLSMRGFDWPFLSTKWLCERFPEPQILEACRRVDEHVNYFWGQWEQKGKPVPSSVRMAVLWLTDSESFFTFGGIGTVTEKYSTASLTWYKCIDFSLSSDITKTPLKGR